MSNRYAIQKGLFILKMHIARLIGCDADHKIHHRPPSERPASALIYVDMAPGRKWPAWQLAGSPVALRWFQPRMRANQWLVQNKHSKTLAKARFSGACRNIFRGTCSRAQLRSVST